MKEFKRNYNNFLLKGNNGSAVLFLHGFSASGKPVEFLLRYLNSKGYTVMCPVLSGHVDLTQLNDYGPEDWLNDAKKNLNELCQQYKKVFLIGASFGGNLAITVAKDCPEVKGIITLESPIFFHFRIWFAFNFIRPILSFFKIDFIKKRRLWYRTRYTKRGDSFPYIPIKTAGKIYNFIKERTMKDIREIAAPMYIIQAERSDLIRKKSAKFIFDNIRSKIKKVEFIPLDNHDLDLFDEKEKNIMLEKIFHFMDKLEKSKG